MKPFELNIIGDVAGQFRALIALHRQMPADYTLCVGDVVDRGPKSKEIIDWLLKDHSIDTLYGNHEDLMLDCVQKYAFKGKGSAYSQPMSWLQNGGFLTLQSYGVKKGDAFDEACEKIPRSHINYLLGRPRYYYNEDEKLLITHAPVPFGIADDFDLNDPDIQYDLIWSRSKPRRRKAFQVHGHNAQWGTAWHEDDQGKFGICIDSSFQGILTGFHWPSRKLYTVDWKNV